MSASLDLILLSTLRAREAIWIFLSSNLCLLILSLQILSLTSCSEGCAFLAGAFFCLFFLKCHAYSHG